MLPEIAPRRIPTTFATAPVDFHRPHSWKWPAALTDATIVVEVWVSDAWLSMQSSDWATGRAAKYLREMGLTNLAQPESMARLNVVKSLAVLRGAQGSASRDSGELATSLIIIGFLPSEGTNRHARTETRDSLVPVIAQYFQHDKAFRHDDQRHIDCSAEKPPSAYTLWERELIPLHF